MSGIQAALVGSFNNSIAAWNLDYAKYSPKAAWDLGTAKYSALSRYTATTTSISGVSFSNNGLNMFILDSNTFYPHVYQYSLSIPWNVATATYTNKFYSFSANATVLRGLMFNDDGTSAYLYGYKTTNTVYQYSLSTPWDVTTLTYTGKSYTPVQPTLGYGFYIRGSNMYVLDYTGATVYQYSLSTAWDVSTTSYASKSFSVSAQSATPQAIFLNVDGTIAYIVDGATDSIYQYKLSTPFDVSTASYSSKTVSFSTNDANGTSLFIKPDGTSLYLTGSVNQTVYQYSLGGNFIGATESNPVGVFVKPDGTVLYVAGSGNLISQFTMSSPFDESTLSYSSKRANTAAQDGSPVDVFFKPDGLSMYVLGNSSDSVYQYTLSTAWDVSTFSYASKSASVASQENEVTGLHFSSDGASMYIVGTSNDTVYQYTLSTPWDVSTASYASKSFSLGTWATSPQSIAFRDNGLEMYITDDTSDKVHQFVLSTAWDVSTASYANKTFYTRTQTNIISGITFNPNGREFFTCDLLNDCIWKSELKA